MTEYEFYRIMNDIISSFYIEGIIIPDELVDVLKNKYVPENLSTGKILVKNKGDFYDDKRTK